MKKNAAIIVCILGIWANGMAQNEWRHRACLPASGNVVEAVFSTGNKGYIIGRKAAADVWQYDASTDVWQQMHNFPVAGSGFSTFEINDTAYVGLGLDTTGNYHQQMWRYDALNDQWISVANFPGAARYLALSFGLNGKGYIGCGKNDTPGQFKDFYQYDPGTNSWTQKTDFPGTGRQTGLGVAMDTLGYMGLGYTDIGGTRTLTDIYSYHPSTNSWLQIAGISSNGSRGGVGRFVLNDTLYIAGGTDLTNLFSDCWRYDAQGNFWVQQQGFDCIAPARKYLLGGFTLNGHGYIVSGDNFQTQFNDLLEFGAKDNSFIQSTHILGNDTTYCGNFSRVLSTAVACTQWSTGVTSPSITVTTAGTYWARYNDSCGIFTDTISIGQTICPTPAPYEWRHRACLPAAVRAGHVSFSVGNKGYIAGGTTLGTVELNDVWRFDASTDQWTKMNNFPVYRSGAVVFVINDTAYVGLGTDASGAYQTGFWRYNVANDQWISIATFPGPARYLAMGFALNGKGYVGCGKAVGWYNDFYEYDPSTNSWRSRANFPGTARQTGFGATIGGFGYMGMGNGSTSTFSDVYRYNQASNSWTQVANYGGGTRIAPGFFVLSDTLYLAGGREPSTPLYDDCWRYDVAHDTWIQQQSFSCLGPGRSTDFGFTIGGHGYLIGGDFGNITLKRDVLEFGPKDNSFLVSTHILGNDTTYCGSFVRTLSAGNSCAQWSTGATGSTISIDHPGTYSAIYQDSCGLLTDTIVIAQSGTLAIDSIHTTNITCNGKTDGVITVFASGGQPNYNYNFTVGPPAQSSNIFAGAGAGNYTITVTDNSSCKVTDTVSITQPVALSVQIVSATGGNMPDTLSAVVTGGVVPYTYHWGTTELTQSINILNPGTYSLTITDANLCTDTISFNENLSVNHKPFAMDDLDSTAAFSSVQIFPLANDSDPDTHDALFLTSVVHQPTNGTASIIGVGNNIIQYNPGAGFVGLDTLSYSVCDNGIPSLCDTAIVAINVTCTGCVWPGDANDDGIAYNFDLLSIGLAYGSTGFPRIHQDINWSAHAAQDWTDTLPGGINFKHVDCDGNGTVNADDTTAILQNFGLTHTRAGIDEWRSGHPPLLISISQDSVLNGDSIIATISLGEGSTPALKVYGLAFTVNYDARVVDTLKTSSSFPNSWLGTSVDKISIAKDIPSIGGVKCAVTRIDHNTRSGSGPIGQVKFVITTDNINGKDLAYYTMHVFISDILMMDSEGIILDANAGQDSVLIGYFPNSVNEISADNINVYPNPANDRLWISSKQYMMRDIVVRDLLGEMVLARAELNAQHTYIDLSQLSNGTYFVEITTAGGKLTKRVVVVR